MPFESLHSNAKTKSTVFGALCFWRREWDSPLRPRCLRSALRDCGRRRSPGRQTVHWTLCFSALRIPPFQCKNKGHRFGALCFWRREWDSPLRLPRLRSALRDSGRRRSPGQANRPPDALLFHPSNPFHPNAKTKGTVFGALCFGGESGILRFASRRLRSALRDCGRRRSPGQANRPPDALLFCPSNPSIPMQKQRAPFSVLFVFGGESGIRTHVTFEG